MNFKKWTNCLVLLSLLGLAGCSFGGGSVSELEEYVNATINREPGPIEPLPEFTTYAAFTYSAVSMRGPFDIPVDISDSLRAQNNERVQPDANRPQEALEAFALGSLRMVGSMSRDGETWALILDENNGVNRVSSGSYLGKNHGRIISNDKNQINIIEIVPNGDGGWIERPQIITLAE